MDDLHDAARLRSAGEVAARAAEAADVDALREGRTALWQAVFDDRPDNARALVAAGADPHRPMMAGWSPARLAAAGPAPGLFGTPAPLTAEETAVVAEARRLSAALSRFREDGLGIACVAGVDVAETVRRLGAVPCERTDFDDDVLGVTDVPGGVVVIQPWGYRPQEVNVHERLSVGTVCYGLYENPKSGAQGSISRDGVFTHNDLFPGGDPWHDNSAFEVLLAYVHRLDPVAYSCAYAGLRLTGTRPLTDPDMWIRMTP